MNLRLLLILVLLAGTYFRSSAQLSFGGNPASFSVNLKSAPAIPFIDMAPVNNLELIRLEQANPKHLKKLTFAKSFNVDITPSNSGIWTKDGDMNIYLLGLRSKGAFSLNLIFDKMIMPQGASLYIYSPDHARVLGAFTSGSEQSSGNFSTAPIAGEEIILEYNEPKSVTYPGELHISSVNHDYKNVFGTRPLGESGLCNMDVYCPDASNYLTEKQSVVCLLINGNTLCTGTLINNTKQDKTPFLLTAGHCIENTSDAQHTLFCFNYESPACGYGKGSINGFSDQSLSGSILKARSDSLDFSLVELETSPPATYRPYFAGWNHSNAIPTSSASITHPRGDVKKISRDMDPPKIGSFDSDFTANSFWIIGKWEIGTTEGGSSGGSLLNQNKQIIGTLTGGTSVCSDPTNDLFAMFAKQWDFEKGSDKQLKPWLDPNNTGVTELAGLSPFDIKTSCTLFTNSSVGEKDTLLMMANKTAGYKTGTNSQKISFYAERFTKTQQALLTSVSLGVGRLYSQSSNQNSKITLKVFDEVTATGLPGNELVSMDIPFSLLSEKKMNYIELSNPVVVKNRYFAGIEINYSNPTDSFALYCAPNRVQTSKNRAYAKSGGIWRPFYTTTGLGISTSLLINTNSCENTLSSDSIPADQTDVPIFKRNTIIIRQNIGLNDYLLLENTGDEIKSVNISLYDIIGRKLFENIQDLPKNSQVSVSPGHLASGLYFLTFEDGHTRQVLKFQVNFPR